MYVAAGVVVLDGVVLGQGVLAFLCGVVVSLVLAVAALASRDAVARRRRLRDAVLCMFVFPCTLAIMRGNEHLARSRADVVVAACDAFHARHGRYPDDLDELVPDFLDAVPRASVRVVQGKFRYWRLGNDDDAMLVYWTWPPFLHRTYSFKARRWMTLD